MHCFIVALRVNPLCANEFFLLILYNQLGMVHCIYWGSQVIISKCDCISYSKINLNLQDPNKMPHKRAFLLTLHCFHSLFNVRKNSKIRKSQQSSATPDPGHHMGKWQKHTKNITYQKAKRLALTQMVTTRMLDLFVCLICFFTSTQQSFSYAGRFFLGLTSTKLG